MPAHSRARLLTNAPLPAWLKEPEEVKAAAAPGRRALRKHEAWTSPNSRCSSRSRIPDITTTVAGSANPKNIRNWAKWAAEPLDEELLREVQAIFAPVKNLGHREGLPENN